MRIQLIRLFVCSVVVLANEANGKFVRFYFDGKVALVPATAEQTTDGTTWTITNETMYCGTLASPNKQMNTGGLFRILKNYECDLTPNSVNPKFGMTVCVEDLTTSLASWSQVLPLAGIKYKKKVLKIRTVNAASLDCRLSFVDPTARGFEDAKSTKSTMKLLVTDQLEYNNKFYKLASIFKMEEIVILEEMVLSKEYNKCLDVLRSGTVWCPHISPNPTLPADDIRWWAVESAEIIYSDETYSAVRLRIGSKLQVWIQFYIRTRSDPEPSITGPAIYDSRKRQIYLTTTDDFTMQIHQKSFTFLLRQDDFYEHMNIQIYYPLLSGEELGCKAVTVVKTTFSGAQVILHVE